MEHAKKRENFEKFEMAIAVFSFASSTADDELVDPGGGIAREGHFFARAEGLRGRNTM
ncbi:MAG: hypothetical protein R6U78_17640 [Bacteroidales bacterium]